MALREIEVLDIIRPDKLHKDCEAAHEKKYSEIVAERMVPDKQTLGVGEEEGAHSSDNHRLEEEEEDD